MKTAYDTPVAEKLEFDYSSVVAESLGDNNGGGNGDRGNGRGGGRGCGGTAGHFGANNGHGCDSDTGEMTDTSAGTNHGHGCY